jgi:hypothetical protein
VLVSAAWNNTCVPLNTTLFLISPANLGGKRGKMIMNPEAGFELARQLHTPAGAALGDVFAFVSGLYFRGKMTYAKRFGHAADGQRSSFVMTAGGGLCSLDESVTLDRLRGWQSVAVSEHNPHFTAPLQRHASMLLDAHGDDTRFVLLGSVASKKYVAPLLEVFETRLLFPELFAGLGDMSRGSLLLRAVREDRELEYVPLASRSP